MTDVGSPEFYAAVTAAFEGGEAVMEVYSGEFAVREKDDGSPVTEADTRSHEVISGILGGTGHPILSEEGADSEARRGNSSVWIVDPLDGTADFVDRTGEFTVMVGLIRDGAPAVGAVYWPAGDTMYAAEAGRGAFRRSGGKWEPVRATAESAPEKCRAVCSRNHMSELDRRVLDELRVARVDAVGSSLKVCRIAGGEAELYASTTGKMREWDTCASCCILTEAGGRMTDTLGNALRYNGDTFHRDGIVATNGAVHGDVLEAVKRARGS